MRPVSHVVIPDCQVRPGVPTSHLEAAGNYIADKRPDVIVHLGDHWDMPSLSSYEKKGSMYFEGKRYASDVQAGNEAMERLVKPIVRARGYRPRRVFTMGNHEQRIARAVAADPILHGTIGYDDLYLAGWEVHDFLDPVLIDGILYSHYFVNQQSLLKSVLGGTIDNRLNKVKSSFTMGHQQTRMWGSQFTSTGKELMGLVVGCLTPDHRVLTADLRYVPLGDLRPGDKVFSFDEHAGQTGRSRRYRTGTVLRAAPMPAPVWAVELASGKVFKVTADHGWLVKTGSTYRWTTTARLRVGTCVPRLFDEWEPATTYEAGWLAGMYDGEGHLYNRPTSGGHCLQLGLSQKRGPTLTRALAELARHRVLGLTHTTHGEVEAVRLQGGLREIARLLGVVRPQRLLEKFSPDFCGSVCCPDSANDKVVAIRALGVQDIMQTEIDMGTYIVEGYGHHNSFYQHDEEYMGPQGNHYWRGIVFKHEVTDGRYDPMFVSLDYLLREWL